MILTHKLPNFIDIRPLGDFEVNSKEDVLNLEWVKWLSPTDLCYIKHEIEYNNITLYWLYYTREGTSKIFRIGEFKENPELIGISEYKH